MPCIGRFAPSPTGRMHLGNRYTAYASYLRARQQGGKWIVRIEDIDPQRSKPEFAKQILDDLDWLGLRWDGLYYQTERYERYELALSRLETFPLYKSRKERLSVGAPQAGDNHVAMHTQKPATAIRIPNADGTSEDIILRRSDGAWAYQLAVVVDDAEMGVTEVVRGDDLACCVQYHHYLQDLLGYPHPIYKHIPLLYNEAGQRLCKRDKDMDMGELRKRYSPAGLRGILEGKLRENGVI